MPTPDIADTRLDLQQVAFACAALAAERRLDDLHQLLDTLDRDDMRLVAAGCAGLAAGITADCYPAATRQQVADAFRDRAAERAHRATIVEGAR